MRLATPLRATFALVLSLSAGTAVAQNAARSLSTADQTAIGSKTATELPGPTTSFGQGGPDAFGYTWIDSDEPGGPAFVWNDISATGTAVTLTDDSSVDVALPFSFSFYGALQSTVRIGSNGFLAFGGTANPFTNAAIPTAAAPNNLVAGFWDDLNPSDGGTIHHQAGAGTFTVQYTNVPRFAADGFVTFQIVLNQDGTMRFYYNSMVGTMNSASIGIEDGAGAVGLQVAFNTAYVHDAMAVLIQALPPPTASVTPPSLTFNLSPGGSDTQPVTVSNTAPPGSGNLLFDATIFGNPVSSLTQSTSMDVVPLSGVACPGGDNFLYRVFDLTAMGVTEPFTVTSIDFGIETSTPRPSTVTLYTLSGPFVVANLTQVAQVPFAITGQVGVVVNVPISHTFQPTDVMVVEWAYDNAGGGATFFGGNGLGQTAPTYVRSIFCSLPEPADLATIGFPDSHWALTVNGAAGGPPVVTATGTSGTVAPGASSIIQVSADATGLAPGTYPFSLEIDTNDPANPSISVPITVNVTTGGPVTYPSTDTPQPIADGTGSDVPGPPTISTITVPPSIHQVLDVDIHLDMTHSFAGDLHAVVEHNAATSNVYDRPGRTTTGFGCGGDNPDLIIDDEGTGGPVETSCLPGNPAYPLGVSYTPNSPLTVFDGMNVEGDWVLTVTDNAGADTGGLDGWAIIVTEDLNTSGPNGPVAREASLRVLPNPMSTSGSVELIVPVAQDVRVAVYDMLGREVMVIFEGSLDASQRALISVAAGRLNAGSYVVRAVGETFERIERVTIAR